jgi:hypothetical protein
MLNTGFPAAPARMPTQLYIEKPMAEGFEITADTWSSIDPKP